MKANCIIVCQTILVLDTFVFKMWLGDYSVYSMCCRVTRIYIHYVVVQLSRHRVHFTTSMPAAVAVLAIHHHTQTIVHHLTAYNKVSVVLATWATRVS